MLTILERRRYVRSLRASLMAERDAGRHLPHILARSGTTKDES
jgi:hypothetical protein